MMLKSNIARSLIAFLMCVVLLFAITPKRTIHDIFGCHNPSDVKTERSAASHTQFNNDGFHCSCDQTEFQPGFIYTEQAGLPEPLLNFLTVNTGWLPAQDISCETGNHLLRGPPALA